MKFEENTAIRCHERDLEKCFKFLHGQGLEWRFRGNLLTDNHVLQAIYEYLDQNPNMNYIYFLIETRENQEPDLCWGEEDFGHKLIEFRDLMGSNDECEFSATDYLAVLDSVK